MLPVDLLIVIIAFIGNVFLGLLTFLKNPKSATSRLFFMFLLAISAYILGNYVSLHQTDVQHTFYWIKVVMITVPVMNFLFFLLVDTFPRNMISTKNEYILSGVITTVLLVVLTMGNAVFSEVRYVDGNISPVPSWGMVIFLLHTIVFLGSSLALLVYKEKRFTGPERAQVRLFLLGTGVFFGATIVTNLLLVLVFNNSLFVGFVPLYTLFFAACTAYAIIKHGLLDIQLIVARAVSYTLFLFLIGMLYIVGFTIVSSYYLNIDLESPVVWLMILITMVLSFSFQYVKRAFEKLSDRIFYQDRYDTNDLLYRLTRIATSSILLDDVARDILKVLLKELRVSRGAFVLISDSKVVDTRQQGFSVPPVFEEVVIQEILHTRDTILYESLEDGALKKSLKELGLATVVHLRTHGDQVGILVLGQKESGSVYTEQDLNFLEIFAPEAAVIIQNVRSYQEIQRFNITLQEKIDDATGELKDANEKLKELDKLKDEFVSLASHELRTPMTAIRGSLATILEGYAGDITKEARDFLTAAYAENDRLIRLVNNLLNISRIESGRMIFTFKTVDINALCEDVVKNLQITAKEKGIYLKFELDGSYPKAKADEDRIKEVLINLVGNSIKHTYEGGIVVRVGREAGMVVVSIQDTGHGIAKEDHDLLFQKFSQVKTTYKKETGGTGLGLYISKQIITGHGGKIWFESAVGKGSHFHFSLPIIE